MKIKTNKKTSHFSYDKFREVILDSEIKKR